MTFIKMRETTEEFRKGFEFCTRAIYDMIKNREEYTLECLQQTLSIMILLMDKDSYWTDIKQIIEFETKCQ